MPKKERRNFLDHLKNDRGILCMDKDIPVCFCSHHSDFPDFKFKIDNIYYYIPKENYVFKDE